MAGDWIKMRVDLFTHPKVVRMMSALKADALRTVGGLMSVWSLFDAHSIDGSLDAYTPEILDTHLHWEGFAAAMISIGWLIDTGESLMLPEFDTHNGASAKRRAQDKDRKKDVRKTSASEPDKKRTREEKSREENISSKDIDAPQAGVENQKRKCRIPTDFLLTPERLTKAVEYWKSKNRLDLVAVDEFQKFVNHFTSNGKPMLDWEACWRTWYTNAITFNRPQLVTGGLNGIRNQSAQPYATRVRGQAAAAFAELEASDREAGNSGLHPDG